MKVAVISDIHANHLAFEAVLKQFNKDNVESILVAGDLIGYYYWPHKIIDIIMEDDRFFCIRGNHERMLKEAIEDESMLLKYRKKYGSCFDVCIEFLNDKQLNWLFSLPEKLSTTISGNDFFMSHGSLAGDKEYIYPNASLEKLISNYSKKKFTIFGNTHYPFIHHNNGQYLINPGSIGQPRDLGGMASYVIIDLQTDAIQFKRIEFTIDSIIEKVDRNDPGLAYLQTVLRR